jgi:hypothetical protein
MIIYVYGSQTFSLCFFALKKLYPHVLPYGKGCVQLIYCRLLHISLAQDLYFFSCLLCVKVLLRNLCREAARKIPKPSGKAFAKSQSHGMWN